MRRLLAVGFLVGMFFGCRSAEKTEKEGFELLSQMEHPSLALEGRSLAEAYCAACHTFPEPALLDSETWRSGVLPDMRRRLGLITEEDFGEAVGEDNDAPDGIYTSSPLITREVWEKIQAFYVDNSPVRLPHPRVWEDQVKETDLFKVHFPELGNKRPTLTTLIRYDSISRKIFLGDRLGSLFRFDPRTLDLLDSVRISSPASEIAFSPDGFFFSPWA